MHTFNLDKDFRRFFPSLEFKLSSFQREAIEQTIANDNTLVIMPTGGGKSVIYWMSALELGGITIVIAPLIALISEQAKKLRDSGYDVLELHGNISADEQMKQLLKLARKEYTPNFIFVSPEKIATDGFFEYCLERRRDDIKLVVIDEVHCVSQWGISFRPLYKRIPEFLNELFEQGNWCKLLALTATLNPKELQDICDSFRIARKNIIKSKILMRSEIQLHVQEFINENEKEDKFWDLIKIHSGEKILVYIYRKYKKRGVEDLCEKANQKGYRAIAFHGDMSATDRQNIIEKYKSDEVNIVFATNAFGMGIDIKDIRVVIHFMIPESVEQYYQEIGRAARDKGGANAYLLYSQKNIDVKRRHFIDASFPDENQLKKALKKIGKNEIGVYTLDYFEDDDIQACLSYLMQLRLIEILGKGFQSFKGISDIADPILNEYYESTKSKNFCTTMKNNNISSRELSDRVYQAIIDENAKASKPLSRVLIVKKNAIEISQKDMDNINDVISQKKKYKHELLDYFINLLKNNQSSKDIHQEICKYLGVDKHQLEKIYTTVDGNLVRSKSEVIICNLLFESKIAYEYEKKLYYGEDGRYIEPDFTIMLPCGKEIYWEHVGLLGIESYDSDWKSKLDIYNKYFSNQLVKTYESGSIATDASKMIDSLRHKEI